MFERHARPGEPGTEIIVLGDAVIEYDPDGLERHRYVAGAPIDAKT